MIRILGALALAPLAVVPVLAVLSAPWALGGGGLNGLAQLVSGALVISYPSTLAFGLPVHFVLTRARYTSLFDYSLMGALLGALPTAGYCLVAIAFDAHFSLDRLWWSITQNVRWGVVGTFYFSTCSATVAAAFWRLAARTSIR